MRYMRGDRGKRVDVRYDLKGRTQGRRDGRGRCRQGHMVEIWGQSEVYER